MANIFDGFKTAIYNYMHADKLTARSREKVEALYSKDYYDMATIDDIAATPVPEEEDREGTESDG